MLYFYLLDSVFPFSDSGGFCTSLIDILLTEFADVHIT